MDFELLHKCCYAVFVDRDTLLRGLVFQDRHIEQTDRAGVGVQESECTAVPRITSADYGHRFFSAISVIRFCCS